MICENYWFRWINTEELEIDDFEFKTERINCEKTALYIIFSEYSQKHVRVCKRCKETIELTDWLHSPEGQAELERQDPWETDNESN